MTLKKSHAALVLLFVLPLSLVTAAESGETAEHKKPETPAPKPAEEPKVWTTEDLNRLSRLPGVKADPGPPGEPAAVDPAVSQAARSAEGKPAAAEPAPSSNPRPAGGTEVQASEDPLAWLEARKTQKAERRSQIAEAEQRVAGLEMRARELESAIRATRNPLLKRPEIPEEKRDEYRQMSAPERLATAQAELDQVQTELQAARTELQRLRSAS